MIQGVHLNRLDVFLTHQHPQDWVCYGSTGLRDWFHQMFTVGKFDIHAPLPQSQTTAVVVQSKFNML